MRQFLKAFLFILFCFAFSTSFAQHDFDEYRTADNPLYWKNRMPDAAYWQQDVHYWIAASMDETEHCIDAVETLSYYNNSPDTLTYVFFHLYQNAFVKGSYLHGLEEEKGQEPHLGQHEKAGEGTIVTDMKADGETVKTELDNTILKVYLNTPLLPGHKVDLSMNFKTWYDKGGTRRRMQIYDAWGFMHYNGCQWYPKVCVYDRKFGWDTYQHLNKEFYGDFGVFDVSLDFPSNYVLEATGELVNRKQVLPDTLREKLDIKNFANKKWNEPPSIITPYVKGERKSWKYHAENVHDFAFTADPSYRISTRRWFGIECVAICQEPHCAGWQNAADYVAQIVKTFSQDIGMYQYPKMVAADAQDGMEYPMITMDGGSEPGYRSLFVHEIGHNWFYGMVGSNETYRAAMDEGFTQFLTAWGMRRIDGDTMIIPQPKSKYRKRFYEPTNVLDRNVLNAYTFDALNKNELPLNTHSNDFHDALGHEGGYRQVYYKTASMLYNLQYTLGDSLFKAAMQHYFNQWRFAHPYFEDFRNSIIQFTHADLNWFFDEWLETTKTIDYSVGRIKNKGAGNWDITLRRKGLSQMPIDFTVTANDGTQQTYSIPNTWFSRSGSDVRGIQLPKWYGWGKIQPNYTAHITAPSGVRRVQIDTSFLLADRYYPDNVKNTGLFGCMAGTKVHFDGGMNGKYDRRYAHYYWRPDVWWNPVDGIKAGLHAEGDYLFSTGKLDASVWFNTHFLQEDRYLSFESEGYYSRYAPVNYSFNYSTPLVLRFPKLQLQLNSRFLDGEWLHRGGLAVQADDKNYLQLYFQTFYRPDSLQTDYLLYPAEWSSFKHRPNASLNLAWTHNYGYSSGAGRYTFSFRAPLFTGNRSDAFDYTYGQFENVNYNRIDKLELRTRLIARYGTGHNLPYESMLYTQGANPEEMMENKFTRSVGFVPHDWQGFNRYETNHFQQGGGLGLRGYAGYFIADERDGEILIGYKNRSGVALNAELDFDGLINFHPKFMRNWLHVDAYVFGDAGVMELSHYSLPDFTEIQPTTNPVWSDVRLDGGVGFAFTIKQWGVFEKAKPLTLRIDFPFLLNRPPYANPQYATFRYVVGINRSF